MAIAFVSANHASSASANSRTVAITPTAGSLLVLAIGTGGPTTTVNSVSDTQGNTWNRVVNRNFLAGVYGIEVWRAENVAAGATTITVSISASTAIVVNVAEFSGAATSSSFDVSESDASTSATTTPTSGATVTTAQADELLFGYIILSPAGATVTEPTGWTSINTNNALGDDFHIAYDVVSATGTYEYNPTLDVGKKFNALIATFKAPAAAGGGTSPYYSSYYTQVVLGNAA